jgi:hypothetical protein
LATAAIIAGGAAEIQNVADHHPASKPDAKHRTVHRTQAAKHPVPATAQTPAQAAATTQPPATATPPADPAAAAPPAPTVTVPPTTDPTTGGTAAATTGATAVAGKHKHHKPIANSDSKPTPAPQTGPVTTGVEPAVPCDADGDGVTDPGAPATCTTGTSVDTGVVSGGDVTPAAPTQYSAAAPAPKKHHAAPKKKSRR